MQLKENEILVLEGAEDFDVHIGSTVTSTQVKDVTCNLTLRSTAIIDALNNFWDHSERNPGYEIVLRFLTTTVAGEEQGSPFGSGQKGLEYWISAERDDVDIEPIRAFLITLGLAQKFVSFIQSATVDELRDKLIRRIRWDLGNKPREALQYLIEDKLKLHGFKLGINSHYSCQALDHLLKKVVDLLSTPGLKELRLGDFISSFDEATSITVPRSEVAAVTSGGALQQLVAMIDSSEISRLVNRTSVIGNPVPIVDDGIARKTIVANISSMLREQRVIFMCGSSGLGKTNLASLISDEIGGIWGWAGFRDMPPEQIKDVLSSAAFEINSARLLPFLVLDDVDLSRVVRYEREFISLVFSVINADGMVIITGPTRPPLQLFPKIWKSEICEVNVPYFNESEIAEMVRVHGLSDNERVTAWAKIIWLTTSGHPQLVHARVRNLSARGWPAIEPSDFSKPEDVERVREEARERLAQELPTDNTRVLAYRLSLINGAFTRETAIAVAEIPPPTKLPGEAFDKLVGPWIEREGHNRYRVSPLLTGAANNVLSRAEIATVHGAIALSIIGSKSINQFEVGTALFHAFMAKHKEVLALLANTIITIDSNRLLLLYDAMSWYIFVGLESGERILPESPGIDLMLRLAQYKLIAASPETDKALAIIGRIIETLNEITPPEFKQHSEALAYGMILNAIEVQIPSSIVIRILSRIIDLSEENTFFGEISDSFSKRKLDSRRLGENKPAQILFSYQAVRLAGLNDLFELVEALDALPSNKRDQLLSVCSSDVDFASLLINRAWWKEAKDGRLDVNKAIRVFEVAAKKSREWKTPELTIACHVAMAIVWEDYGQSTANALGVLDSADKEFPNDALLVNQRAKVLFHANRDLEALPIAKHALELPSLPIVEFIYCCRNAGIAVAKSGDWEEAERLFLLGAERAKNSGVLKRMGIGLMSDAAFALWKQEQFARSLSIFADVLDALSSIPVTEDIRIRHLHATVRHSISWIHFNARGEHSANIVEPFPGMCSNQDPNEGIKDHRIIDISASWDLLASTERIFGVNIGIAERSQRATGGKKPLLMVVYSRTLALESTVQSKDFANFIPKLIAMLEAFQHSKAVKDGKVDEWAIGDLPKLPDTYWDNPENLILIYSFMLAASIICTANNQAVPLPIDRWRADLTKASALSTQVDQFLNVLNGGLPDNSFPQQAAAALFALRNGNLSPVELWKASFRLLNATMETKRLVETALADLLVPHWLFSTKNQRFAFSIPAFACPEIERCCLDNSLSGLAKIAKTLDVAAAYLPVRLSPEAKQMLSSMIQHGGE